MTPPKKDPVAADTLEFEKPLMAIQQKIEELETLSKQNGITLDKEVRQLRKQAEDVKSKLYKDLSASQRLQIARHPKRPNCLEVIKMLSPDTWFELHGDRSGHDDRAIIGGIIELDEQPLMVVGTQKGRGMKENLTHNFGMANPEGYKKALRLFHHAEKFKMPVLTLIDTPGAYPGIGGEQNGIGFAIAHNIREMARLRVPIISIVMGEASSGGALGIGVANHIYMLENALYTVISPEGCASILWRSAEYASQAADALKITAPHLLEFGIIDGIIEEPEGGAHRNTALTGQRITDTVKSALLTLSDTDPERWVDQRYEKFRKIGAFSTSQA